MSATRGRGKQLLETRLSRVKSGDQINDLIVFMTKKENGNVAVK